MANGDDAYVGQGFEDLRSDALRDLAFFVAKQGGSQVRGGTAIYRDDPPVTHEDRVPVWNAIRDRLHELEDIAQDQAFPIDQYIHHVGEFANAMTNDFAEILHNGRFRIGIAQKVIGLYLKYLWFFDLTPEPTVCPFDRIIIEGVLGMDGNWTQFDDQQTYQGIIDAALQHAEEHGFGQNLAQWELSMYQEHM